MKLLLRLVFILVAGVAVGYGLLAAVSSIDRYLQRRNLKLSSLQVLEKSKDYERDKVKIWYGDTRSDAIMLSELWYNDPEHPFQSALNCNSSMRTAEASLDFAMATGAVDGAPPPPFSNYGRYWNGYRLLLAPALVFLTYDEILCLNVALLVVLAVVAAYGISRRAGRWPAGIFAVVFALFAFPAVPFSLLYPISWYLMLSAICLFPYALV